MVTDGSLEIQGFTPAPGSGIEVTLLGGDPPVPTGTPKTEMRLLRVEPASPVLPTNGAFELGELTVVGAPGEAGGIHLTSVGPGNASGPLVAGDRFGESLAPLGDLDQGGSTEQALAVGAIGDDAGTGSDTNAGAIWNLFLDWDGSAISVSSHAKLATGTGNFAFTYGGDANMRLGRSLAWLGSGIDGAGGVLISGAQTGSGPNFGAYVMFIGADGLYRSGYQLDIANNAATGSAFENSTYSLGRTVVALPDVGGIGIGRDERPDFIVAESQAPSGGPRTGRGYFLYTADDGLDNCLGTSNPRQDDEDTDGVGVGDLCDNCPIVSNSNQADSTPRAWSWPRAGPRCTVADCAEG